MSRNFDIQIPEYAIVFDFVNSDFSRFILIFCLMKQIAVPKKQEQRDSYFIYSKYDPIVLKLLHLRIRYLFQQQKFSSTFSDSVIRRKGESQNWLQEKKTRQIFRKTNTFYPLIRTCSPVCLIINGLYFLTNITIGELCFAYFCRLYDVMHSEKKLTIVFEYCDQVRITAGVSSLLLEIAFEGVFKFKVHVMFKEFQCQDQNENFDINGIFFHRKFLRTQLSTMVCQRAFIHEGFYQNLDDNRRKY